MLTRVPHMIDIGNVCDLVVKYFQTMSAISSIMCLSTAYFNVYFRVKSTNGPNHGIYTNYSLLMGSHISFILCICVCLPPF